MVYVGSVILGWASTVACRAMEIGVIAWKVGFVLAVREVAITGAV